MTAPPAHGAVRDHERAARLGRGHLPQARLAQSRRRDARADHARRSPELALDRRAAAPARLLPDQRRRGLRDRHLARARARLQEAAGVASSAWARATPCRTCERQDWWYLPHQQRLLSRAYRMAGVGPGRHRRGAALRQLHHRGAVLARACRLLQAGRGRRRSSRAASASSSAASCRSTPRAAICRSPTCRAGCTWSKACARSAANAARGRSQDAELCLVTGRGMTLNTASCLILGA